MKEVPTREHDWGVIPTVFMLGDPGARPSSDDPEEHRQVVKSWRRVVIMEASPNILVRPGFRTITGQMHFHNTPIAGRFGMRLGREDVEFFCVPVKNRDQVELQVKEVVDISNPRTDLDHIPLY
jgi:hypothetical protein